MSFQDKWTNFWKVKEQPTANAVPNSERTPLMLDASDALETPEERKLRIRGLWICHVETFIFTLSFSMEYMQPGPDL